MISPTGKGIRSDSEGSGEYGSRRGDRVHNGVDYICVQFQAIVAPFDMKIDREAKPYGDKEQNGQKMSGIKWATKKSNGRLFYFEPDYLKIGKYVHQGEVIGIAQAVSEYHALPKMTDHVHFQINK